jgi:hypothetical protein
MFYVYCLVHPHTNEVFYVGMGSGRRMYSHVQKVKQNRPPNNNWQLYRVIKNILNSGCDVKYKLISNNLTHTEALVLESDTIKTIGLDKLCNLNFGGTGRLPGYKHTEETKQKIAKSNTGKKKSIETKKKIGRSKLNNKNMLGKQHTDETKQKISDSWKHRNLDNYKSAQLNRRRAVVQCDINGNEIKRWDSVTSAIKNFGKSVGDALYRKQKTAYGYVWKFNEVNYERKHPEK